MSRPSQVFKLPMRALGLGFWWAWIYLAILSPAFSQSEFASHPVDGSLLSFLSIASGAVVFALAIPLSHRFGDRLERRSISLFCAALASLSTLGIACGSLFGPAEHAVFVACGILSGVGISVLYLQWGTYYASLPSEHVAPCTLISFLLAIVFVGLALDHGFMTSVLAALLPFAAALTLPFDKPASDKEAASRKPSSSAGRPENRMLPWNVITLIVVFCFAFGLFRVLLEPGESASENMALLLACSAVLAAVMLAIVSFFSISLGWDFILYLTLPLIALSALVLSIVDFGNHAFVWAIIVAAVRCAGLIMWMIFTAISRSSSEPPAAVFALGKLTAQIGVLLGIFSGNAIASTFDVEAILLPTALAFVVLVTLLGSLTAVKGRMTTGFATPLAHYPSLDEQHAATIDQLSREFALSPRESEVFSMLAKGRTIPYIADELVLAKSTVTTHARSIYRKMDIHNRQELIDYVEGQCERNASHE